MNERPYGHLEGMSTARWMAEVPLRYVPLADLVFQQDISLMGLIDSMRRPGVTHSGGDVPFIVEWEGRLYIEDGHHRVARAVLEGRVSMLARVLAL